MEKRPSDLKSLKPGSFVLIDDVPCRVDSVQLSRPGKHGSAKARVTATGLFDGHKKNIMSPASARIDVPIIEKKSAQVLAISGERVQLMDMSDYSTFEASIPDELKDKIKEGVEVLVWQFGQNIIIKNIK